ncbi:sulfate ABC transporter ATP-binding protein [Clostridia bacterium]|nr:sulfate ABC transporter ATP-binding protein [Clostridia bacterium]
MLELKGIKKAYNVGGVENIALDGIDIKFGDKGLVSILGQSGSGKTTALNIIGGLDRYDSGDLIIKGKSTKDFNDKDWDAYRNNSIGFVFQSYNLIAHLSVQANVEMGMQLSGVPTAKRKAKAEELLDLVGLKDHKHKKPTQLSGGQAQRVAIARALANDPEILLCDEPTGALDSTTSVQVMDLIKELSKERLVIMVTHNSEIAQEYADRTVRFKDGKVIEDTEKEQNFKEASEFSLKRTAMSLLTALKLSGTNILTKKGRTVLTVFASAIGIIGIALVLSLSNGFQIQIDNFQTDTIAEFPILIMKETQSVDTQAMANSDDSNGRFSTAMMKKDDLKKLQEKLPATAQAYDAAKYVTTHENIFSDEYLKYLNDIDTDICSNVGYARLVNMNVVRKDNDKYSLLTLSDLGAMMSASNTDTTGISSMANAGFSVFPMSTGENKYAYLSKYYDVLEGSYPKKATDIVFVVDSQNKVPLSALQSFGFDLKDGEEIPFSDIVGMQLRLIDNNDMYIKTAYQAPAVAPTWDILTDEQKEQLQQAVGAGIYESIEAALATMATASTSTDDIFIQSNDFASLFNSSNSLDINVVGVVRLKPDESLGVLSSGFAYSNELSELVISHSIDSEIVKAQLNSENNVMSNQPIPEMYRDMVLYQLGASYEPYMIMLYPVGFEEKSKLLGYLDDYNETQDQDHQIIYQDLAGSITNLTKSVMDGITLVLLAFAAISLIVSLIMISIITYISVLERTKEIGVLRALGARKKDISRVFNAETAILGAAAGAFGILVAWLLTFPANAIIENKTGLENVAQLNPIHALLLFILSTVLTILGGAIPAFMASKKNAVEALRSE